MHKKGQITTFIILGIILLAIVAFVIYVRQATQPISKQAATTTTEVAPVQAFVDKCLQNIGEEGIVHNSLQGGYYHNFYLDTLPVSVPVYFDGFKLSIPTEDKLRAELEAYVKDNLQGCIGNFTSLQGFNVVEEGNVSISTMILGDQKISLAYNYPIKINGKVELRKFSEEYDFRLGKIYNLAKQLASQSQLVPTSICLSCYINAGIENDLTIDSINFERNAFVSMKNLTTVKERYVVITIKDRTTKTPLNFAYAIKLAQPLPVGA